MSNVNIKKVASLDLLSDSEVEGVLDLVMATHIQHSEYDGKYSDADRNSEKRMLERFMKSDVGNMVVAVDGGGVVGLAVVQIRHRPDSSYIYVVNFSVAETHRRKGIGSLMMQTLESKEKREAPLEIELNAYIANIPANGFYMDAGFIPKSTIYNKRVV